MTLVLSICSGKCKKEFDYCINNGIPRNSSFIFYDNAYERNKFLSSEAEEYFSGYFTGHRNYCSSIFEVKAVLNQREVDYLLGFNIQEAYMLTEFSIDHLKYMKENYGLKSLFQKIIGSLGKSRVHIQYEQIIEHTNLGSFLRSLED